MGLRPPDPLPGLCPWTPLRAGLDPLIPPPQLHLLDPPLTVSEIILKFIRTKAVLASYTIPKTLNKMPLLSEHLFLTSIFIHYCLLVLINTYWFWFWYLRHVAELLVLNKMPDNTSYPPTRHPIYHQNLMIFSWPMPPFHRIFFFLHNPASKQPKNVHQRKLNEPPWPR